MAAIAEAAFSLYVPRIGRRPAPMDEDLGAAIAAENALVAETTSPEHASSSARAIAGYATFHAGPHMCDLTTVAVSPDAQGRGIGRRLVEAVEQYARSMGATRLGLYTNAAMAENLTLYPHLGFAETERRVEDGFARVFFEKRLLPAVATKAPVDGLYGRRKGQGKEPEIGSDDPLLLDLSAPLSAIFPPERTVRLEVGFGAGEHLIDHAAREPDIGLIGCEPFETGLARALKNARGCGLTNIRFYQGDARRVFEWLPAGRLDRVDVLYPDPWHKQRHWKRRFISADGLDRLARALRPGGSIRFASDIEAYVAWTRAHVAAHGAFSLEEDSAAPWPHWPSTRYEKKAFREGRTPRYLTLRRNGARAH